MYGRTFSGPEHQLEVNGQLHASAALPPEPTEPRLVSELVWTAWSRDNSRPFQNLNFGSLAIQPIASHYTDCATPAP
jgi:hypothetical protein